MNRKTVDWTHCCLSVFGSCQIYSSLVQACSFLASTFFLQYQSDRLIGSRLNATLHSYGTLLSEAYSAAVLLDYLSTLLERSIMTSCPRMIEWNSISHISSMVGSIRPLNLAHTAAQSSTTTAKKTECVPMIHTQTFLSCYN